MSGMTAPPMKETSRMTQGIEMVILSGVMGNLTRVITSKIAEREREYIDGLMGLTTKVLF